jgi:hypothetical protein
VSPAVFFLRKPDRPPPLAHLPRAAPLPLPWQNESAPLPAHLPDSLFHLPISSPTRNAFAIEAPPAAADSSPSSLRLATPPYKSCPRAPSPHHGPSPRIGSLHPHPYCPPTELHAPPPPLFDVGAPPSSHRPHLPPVRIPKAFSLFPPTHGEETPSEPAARCCFHGGLVNPRRNPGPRVMNPVHGICNRKLIHKSSKFQRFL